MEKTSRSKTRKNNKIAKTKKDIDLALMFKAIWRKFWLVVLVTVVAAGLTFVGAKLFIKPSYRASFTAYVNNKQEVDLSSLTSADVIASKSLVHTYSVLITSRNVLMTAAEKAGVDLPYGSLQGMVSTSISNETEIITVSVVAKSPSLAYALATEIANTAPAVNPEIVEGSSMKIIDMPEKPTGIYSPNYTRLALIGGLAAFIIVVLIICIRQFFNDKVQSETELSEYYNIPVVGTIPDFNYSDKGGSSYYYSYGKTPADAETAEKENGGSLS